MSDYRRIINGIAVSRINTDAYIPDKTLMVGSAELLVSIPLFLYKNIRTMNTSAIVPTNISFESGAPDLQGAKLSKNDFGNTFNLGNPIDGGIV